MSWKNFGTKTIHYVYYDDDDNWNHTIKVERIDDATRGVLYQNLIKAEGRCPPEDIGEPPGYEMYLYVVADRSHDKHDWMIECYGEPENAKEPDYESITAQL